MQQPSGTKGCARSEHLVYISLLQKPARLPASHQPYGCFSALINALRCGQQLTTVGGAGEGGQKKVRPGKEVSSEHPQTAEKRGRNCRRISAATVAVPWILCRHPFSAHGRLLRRAGSPMPAATRLQSTAREPPDASDEGHDSHVAADVAAQPSKTPVPPAGRPARPPRQACLPGGEDMVIDRQSAAAVGVFFGGRRPFWRPAISHPWLAGALAWFWPCTERSVITDEWQLESPNPPIVEPYRAPATPRPGAKTVGDRPFQTHQPAGSQNIL